jgi:hypothetical protein
MKTTSSEPLARKNDLIVKQMPDEVLVYDLARDKAHCLNRTATLVWKYCDGRTSVAKMTGRLGRELQTPVDERVVWLALDQLSKNHLLEERVVPPPVMAGLNRRELIRALGVAAIIAVPVITSIVAPTPAQASTCLPGGAICTANDQCCSMLCSGGTCTPP